MVSMTVELRNVEGTETAMGWAGGHTIVVDRAEGKAGGLGVGFNGAQLLALAIGGWIPGDPAEGPGTRAPLCGYLVAELRCPASRDGTRCGGGSA